MLIRKKENFGFLTHTTNTILPQAFILQKKKFLKKRRNFSIEYEANLLNKLALFVSVLFHFFKLDN